MRDLFRKILENKLLSISLVILGFASGYIFSHLGKWNRNDCISDLKFIRSTLDCSEYDDKSEKITVLQDKLDVVVNSLEKTKRVKRIGVFVRDLNTSRFAGVNDNDVYYLASLLKVPLMIGGYKLAEVEPKILDQKILYTGKPNLYDDQIIKPEDRLKSGQEYTVEDLIERSVEYSDNTTAQLLFDYYPTEFMDRIMQALGIQISRPNGEKENLITPRAYAGVFRVLYNASYLTKEYSNKSLEVLSKVKFDKGATLKIPKNIVVSRKFAERTIQDPVTGEVIKQFHECGIVYPNSKDKYIFCIMTEGDSYESLENAVADVSDVIYTDMVNK